MGCRDLTEPGSLAAVHRGRDPQRRARGITAATPVEYLAQSLALEGYRRSPSYRGGQLPRGRVRNGYSHRMANNRVTDCFYDYIGVLDLIYAHDCYRGLLKVRSCQGVCKERQTAICSWVMVIYSSSDYARTLCFRPPRPAAPSPLAGPWCQILQ